VLAPGLYPRGAPAPTTSKAEQAFHRALSTGLPPGWFGWHSLRVRTKEQFEGEGDFVLAVPDRGVLVIEIKGGAIEKRGGVWLQNGRAMDQAPRAQAHSYKQKLVHKLEERCAGGVPWVAIATAFPDTPYATEPTQGDLEGGVLGQQDLAYAREALLALADRLLAKRRSPRSAKWIDALHALWCETWTPRLSLGARVRLRDQELVPLDQDQLEKLDLIAHNPRFLVRGGPGTGKTLLAREIYRRLTAEAKHPVFVCSTNALAAGLRADGLTEAWTVGEIAAQLLERADVTMQGGAAAAQWSAETWHIASLQAAMDAVPVLGPFYGAVVVDEAQDFAQGDWELVKALAADGPLWAFGDEAQGFWEDRPLAAGLFPASFILKKRYRCPEPLALFADQYRPRGHGAPEPPVGRIDELRLVKIPSAGVLEERVANEIQKALGAGAARSDVAVLSLGGQTRTQLCAGTKIGAFEVVRADDPRAGDSVVADTFLRFKGLERPWVIVTELSLGKRKYDVRAHVALTRATLGCVIVATPEEVDHDPRLAALDATPG
jgi:AAA domain/Nuclease-related domain